MNLWQNWWQLEVAFCAPRHCWNEGFLQRWMEVLIPNHKTQPMIPEEGEQLANAGCKGNWPKSGWIVGVIWSRALGEKLYGAHFRWYLGPSIIVDQRWTPLKDDVPNPIKWGGSWVSLHPPDHPGHLTLGEGTAVYLQWRTQGGGGSGCSSTPISLLLNAASGLRNSVYTLYSNRPGKHATDPTRKVGDGKLARPRAVGRGSFPDLVIPAHAQLTPLCLQLGGLFADLSHLLLLLTVH